MDNLDFPKAEVLLGLNLPLLQERWLRQAVDPECKELVFRNLGRLPDFRILAVVRGRCKQVENDKFSVEVERIAVFPTPTAVSLNALKMRRALVGRVFEQDANFSAELFKMDAVGDADFRQLFEQEVLKGEPAFDGIISVLALENSEAIATANRKKQRLLEAFLAKFAEVEVTKEELETEVGLRVTPRSKAQDASRRIWDSGRAALDYAEGLVGGSSDPFWDLVKYHRIVTRLEEKVDRELVGLFCEKMAGSKAFLAVSLNGLSVMQGYKAMRNTFQLAINMDLPRILDNREGTGGNDVSVKSLTKLFEKHRPVVQMPRIPPEPMDPLEPGMTREEAELISEIEDLEEKTVNVDKLVELARLKRRLLNAIGERIQDHRRRAQAGEFDENPVYQAYLQEHATWATVKQRLLDKHAQDSSAVEKSWPGKKKIILRELAVMEETKTSADSEIKRARLRIDEKTEERWSQKPLLLPHVYFDN